MKELPGKRKKDHSGREVPTVARKDVPLQRFSDNIDKEKLSHFLENSGNDRFDTLMILMQDPAYATCNFTTLCRKANVTLHELQDLYTNGMRQLALLRMSNALPDIMADVAEDAKTRMENCPRCDGFMMLQQQDGSTRECPTCKGKGEIRRVGDKQARELMFESAKLIKQSGPLVAIQQNFGGGDNRMEAILKKTREIVLEPPRITEDLLDKPNVIDVQTDHETKTI